jgi:hypothetical protein
MANNSRSVVRWKPANKSHNITPMLHTSHMPL